MIRFIRDPQPPHNSLYRDGMVRDLGPVLNAQFIASGDAVEFDEPARVFPAPRELFAPGTSRADPRIGLSDADLSAIQALVSRAGNDPEPATRPGRGYVVAADLREANVAARVGSPVITDVERIAPDGRRLRGIRLQSTGAGTNCSFDIAIRSQKFATGRVTALCYADHTDGAVDPNVSLYVGDSTLLTHHYVTNSQVLNARGWHNVNAGLTAGGSFRRWNAGGTPAWGTTDFIRIRVRLDYTTGAMPWVEVYEVNYNEDATSWVALSIDDGYDSAYLIGAPALERFGMRGSFAVIADKIGAPGYMTWDQCRELRDRGHEIIVHGPIGGTGSLANYVGSSTRADDARADAAYHRNTIIREVGNIRGSANVYIYPQGYDRFAVGDETIRDALIAEGFVGGRRAATGSQPKRAYRGSNPWTSPYLGHYWVAAGGEAANNAAIIAGLNSAATEKHDAVMMYHRFVVSGAAQALEINLADLESHLQAIADNRAAGTQENVLFSRMVYAQAGLQRPIV